MSTRITEQDEFLLSRLLDDDLPADEAKALRARLEREPELRVAYEAFRKIDRALASRRADRPDINFDDFHAEVMQAVEAEALTTTASGEGWILKFPGWFKVGLPLAAAAAIALVVTTWDRSITQEDPGQDVMRSPVAVEESERAGDGTQIVQITDPRKETRESGRIMVQFNRPSGVIEPERNIVRVNVNFQRSDTLARQVEQEDNAQKTRPAIATAAPAPGEPKVIVIDQDFLSL